MLLGWVFAAGLFLALLVLDAFLGGFTGALIGLLCWLVWRRRSWERAIPLDTLVGAAAFAMAEMGALVLGQLREYIPTYLGPAFVAPVMTLYEHNFRAGFVAAAIATVVFELLRPRER